MHGNILLKKKATLSIILFLISVIDILTFYASHPKELNLLPLQSQQIFSIATRMLFKCLASVLHQLTNFSKQKVWIWSNELQSMTLIIKSLYYVSRQYLNIQMIVNRAKNCKSETPTRTYANSHKISPGLGMTKKSDPFLKDLKQVYDKENINPNVKQNRVKSQHLKGDGHEKSPSKKNHLLVTNKSNLQNNNSKPNKENYQLGSNSKFTHSSQLQKNSQNTRNSNRKSTEKEEVMVSHFEEEYYNKKQEEYHSKKDERREKKMRVTLKDVRRHRKSIQQSEQDYNSKIQEETKDSFSKDLLNSLKIEQQKEQLPQNNKLKTEQSATHPYTGIQELRCANHFEKKASHRLLEGDNNIVLCEKCAINLITKGHKMQQLHNNTKIAMNQEDLKQFRRNKIYGFLHQADKLYPLIRQNWSELQIYRSLVNQKFQEETIELREYYNRLKSEVEESYQKSQMNLKIYFQSVVQEIQKNESSLKSNQDSLQGYRKDIIPNMNSIVQVELVAQENFTEIMQNYYKNLKQIELSLKDIAEYNYCIYQYDYDINNLKLPNLKEFVSPQIKVYTLRERFQTTRQSVESSSEKKLDPFRLSFGKKVPQLSHRIL